MTRSRAGEGNPAAGAGSTAGVVDLVHARAREERLLAPGRPVLVMLSGGRDSVCLLALAVEICGPGSVEAMHMNFGLREEADAEAGACQDLCRVLGIPLSVHRPRSPARGNLQAWARCERYAAARERAGAGVDIASGHTATDQVETILYRIASSPSRRALLGMRPREGGLVRPLLAVTREQTTAYCRARELTWRDDAGNETDAFARGRIRNELVPALRRLHPAAEANVLALAEILRDEAAVLEREVERVLAGREEVPLATLRELPLALARLVLQELADSAGGRPSPGTSRRVEELLALGDHAELDLPHGIRAVTRRGILRLRART